MIDYRKPSKPDRMLQRRRSVSGLGLGLVLIGLVVLAVTYSVLPAVVYRFWPLILVAVGTLGILRRPGWMTELDLAAGPEVTRVVGLPRRILSWFLVGLGAILLLFTARVVDERVIGPALLVALGIFLIWRRAR